MSDGRLYVAADDLRRSAPNSSTSTACPAPTPRSSPTAWSNPISAASRPTASSACRTTSTASASASTNPRPDIRIERVTPVAASVDGDNGFGFVVAHRAMAEAIEMAREYGIGLASVRHSNHFGMAASYVLQAIRAGMMSLVFTNASSAMPPWGGRDPVLGTSPFAAGAPGGKLPGFLVDMAPAVAARGKIRLAQKRGEPIPEGWALDKEGRPTTDPAAALDDGVVLPMAGPKGSALSMMMDIFGGVFSGSAFAGEVTNHTLDFKNPQTSATSSWPSGPTCS